MKLSNGLLPCVVGLSLLGCGGKPAVTQSQTESKPVMGEYLLATEPAGAMAVGVAKKDAANDSKVTVVGRIGGSEKPFVDGIAAFTIVDPKVEHCKPDEGCPTPWDYCCTTDQLPGNMAMVKVVDAQGKAIAQDARAVLGVKELSMVVVQGSAKRDAEGNLTLLAEKVYVRR
ncbi:hypothetical protein Pan44_10510 [Caulifigura coniformis]|uniref:Uncharacterized protein n=1 Tax=Caulifigura coniformis TaxID=2527983 RepID=A0A517SAD4_9PLAN|nr:hypothetical protein [Caulifigura coniformis]QDT53036.1 hypothetical protein Pan44_10510 [Caulifigura coniformis]